MKSLYFMLLGMLLASSGFAQLNLTVDVSCSDNPAPTEVRMTGPFWGWDPAGGPIASDNGDGTWTVTLDPAPTADMEYLWVNDGVQENLVPAVQNGGTCAPVTDGASYANRLWTVGSPDVMDDTYAQCSACGAGCTDMIAENYDPGATSDDGSCVYAVTFIVDMNQSGVTFTTPEVNGTYNGWCGGCNQLADPELDGIWEGTFNVPGGDQQFKFAADSWAVQENFVGGEPCTIDDGGNINRIETITGPMTVGPYCWNECAACAAVLNLTVDVSCSANPTPTEVRMTGPFWGWDVLAGPVAMDNGNGTWTVTLDPIPTTDMEYLWVIDGVQEDLVLAVQNGGTCAPITDGATYANRLWTLGSPDVTDDTYAQCSACGAGCTDMNAVNYDSGASQDDGSCLYAVTFIVDMNQVIDPFTTPEVNGTYNGWCGGCNPLADPELDGIWEGTFNVPGGDQEFKFAADAWAIQEEFTGGETCTITNGGFTNRLVNVSGPTTVGPYCWNSCFSCDVAAGCTDPNAQNFDNTANTDDGSCTYLVTFMVDMNNVTDPFTTPEVNGTYNGWCGGCDQLADPDLDGVWEGTFTVPNGMQEFKFAADAWAIQENFVGGESCTVTIDGFTNRVVDVTGDTTVGPVCWESCVACPTGTPGCTDMNAQNYDPAATEDDGSCTYLVTFRVDMNQVTDPFTTPEVNGVYNGWCGGCNPLADPDLDGVWEGTFEVSNGMQEYKFAADAWAIQENFVGGESCTITTDGFTNRVLDVTGNTILPIVCWESCTACPAAQVALTFRVDMSNEVVDAAGIHIAGSFQGWDPVASPMNYLGYGIYEYTITVDGNTSYDYKFINGNDFPGSEIVPMECGIDDGFGNYNRQYTTTTVDEMVQLVCFGACEACAGCTDPFSVEYNPFAGSDDGSCATPVVNGCTYADADNYDPAANSDDGSCTFTVGSDCPEDLNNDGLVNAADLLQFLSGFGTVCP